MNTDASVSGTAASIMRLVDFTSLSSTDNKAEIEALCRLAKDCRNRYGLPKPAAICVYPPFVAQVKLSMRDTGVAVSSVAGAFPSGQSPMHIRLAEVRYCIDEGADEIDMVISRGRFLEGDESYIAEEVRAFKDICGNKILKVILETADLPDAAMVRSASRIALDAGADFIKTSTGKASSGAMLESSAIMLNTIDEYRRSTGKLLGFKAAGGISTIEQALGFMNMAKEILGEEFVNPTHFRIGASRVVHELIASR